MVHKKKIIFAGLFLILFIIASILVYIFSFASEESFSVKTLLLKSNIPLGGEGVSKVKITNNKDITAEFQLYLEGFDGLATLSEKKLLIGPHSSKEISVFFKDSLYTPGVYSSELVISDGVIDKKIPTVLVLEDPKSVFSIISTEIQKYSNVYSGGQLGIETKVYDLDDVNDFSVKAKYYIQSINGEILWSDEGDLVVDGSKIFLIDIPSEWKKGDYIFVILIDYRGIKSVSGYFFEISDKQFSLLEDATSKFLVLVVLIFVVGFIILFFYLVKTRDEFLIRLKQQQTEEMDRNRKLIELSKQRIQQSSKQSFKEKKRKICSIEKAEKKIIKKIKKRQIIQQKDLKSLKKQNKKNELKKKLESWKKQGYKMSEAENEMKRLGATSTQINQLKKQGYKI